MSNSEVNSLGLCPICGHRLARATSEGLCLSCLLQAGIDGPEESPEPSARPHPDYGLPPNEARFFGDYELLREVGRGGMGIVYEARQFGTQRTVALKLLNTGILAAREAVHRFHTEAQAASLLEHRNIVPIYEVGMHDGQYFLAMRFLGGGTLAELAARERLLPARIAGMMQEIAAAIHFAHIRGVLHRDLKPSNILVSDGGIPVISDFGLARLTAVDDRITLSASLLGTVAYMAPELIQGGAGCSTISSDVYALGAVLYELLTGQPPFQSASIGETLRLTQVQEPVPPSRLAGGVRSIPGDLEIICLKCLDKDPVRRYATAQELADDLHRFRSDEPIHARPVGRAERAWRWYRRNPALGTVGALALVLLLVVLFGAPVAVFRINRARESAQTAQAKDERELYFANMRSASDELRDGHFDRVRELLTRYESSTGTNDLRGFEWRYLKNSVNQSGLVTCRLEGLKGTVAAPDSVFVVAGDMLYNSLRGTEQIRAWNTTNWAPIECQVPIVQASSRWWWLAQIQSAFCWNDLTGALTVYRLPGFEEAAVVPLPGPPLQIRASRDSRTVAVALLDVGVQNVLLFEIGSNSRPEVVGKYRGKVQHIVFSLDSAVLAVACDDGEIELWSIADRKPLPSPARIASAINENWALLFGPTSKQLFLKRARDHKTLEVWDWSTGKADVIYRAEVGGFSVVGFSADRTVLAVGGADNAIVLLDTRDYHQIASIPIQGAFLASLALSASGRWLAWGRFDGCTKIWDVEARREVATLGGNFDRVGGVGFTADERALLTLNDDGHINVWDLGAIEKRGLLWKIPMPVGDFALSADERTFAARDSEFQIHVWDRASRRELGNVQTDEGPSIALSLTHHVVAWAGWKEFGVFDYQSRQTKTVQLPRQGFCIPAFSPDGQEIAFAGPTNIFIWSVAAQQARTFAATSNTVFGLAFSPDGRLLASGEAQGGDLLLWDCSTGLRVGRPALHTPAVFVVAFAPGGKMLASGSSAGSVELWDVTPDGLMLRHTLTGHAAPPILVFSPDGQRLISGSDVLKLWDTATGQEAGRIYGHGPGFVGFSFSHDGNAIYSADESGEVRIWEAPLARQLEAAAKEKEIQP